MANKKSLVHYVDFELILTGLFATLLSNLCYLALLGRIKLWQYFIAHVPLMSVACDGWGACLLRKFIINP